MDKKPITIALGASLSRLLKVKRIAYEFDNTKSLCKPVYICIQTNSHTSLAPLTQNDYLPLGHITVARRVSALSGEYSNTARTGHWQVKIVFNPVTGRLTPATKQLAVFVRMVLVDFSSKEEFLNFHWKLQPEEFIFIMLWRTTLRKKLVSVPTGRAPAMTGRHSGFVAHCKQHQDFNEFCIIHQQAMSRKVMGFASCPDTCC